MAVSGWMVNLSGKKISVYKMNDNGSCSTTRLGYITANECFVEGTVPGTGWEGVDTPVVILNSSHIMTMGVYSGYYSNLVDFAKYASNGSSWVSVSTLKRKVQYATVAYYADGSKCCDLAAGSYVWLTNDCTRGLNNMNYCAVTKVQTASGTTYNFSGNGFVDLTYGGRWVNVGSILLRKA